MRTHLSRVVFRKLLAEQPIAHHGCLRRPLPYHVVPHSAANALPRAQRRSMFNMFRQKQRQPSEPIIDPGLEKMIEFSKMQRMSARLPPAKDVVHALSSFITHKLAAKDAVQDVQAQHMLRILSWLRQTQNTGLLDLSWFSSCFLALNKAPRQVVPEHRALVALLAQEFRKRKADDGSPLTMSDLRVMVHAQCRVGATPSARDTLIHYIQENPAAVDSPQTHEVHSLWKPIFSGFAKEANEPEMLRSLELIREHNMHNVQDWAYLRIAMFYAEGNQPDTAITWYSEWKGLGTVISPYISAFRDRVQDSLLKSCLRTSRHDLGQSIIREITASDPTKLQWELLMEWAAGTGKGADEIDRMIGVMERSNKTLPENEQRLPSVSLINRLVKLAVSRKDPYLAERFIELGRKRNIEPDVTTLVLQMEYRLAVKDIDGALVVYKHLQSHDLSKGSDVPVVNELVRAMCASGRQDFESIMNVAADLSDRRARFEPATVSALSILHLSRDELHDVIDLLNTHVNSFTSAERSSVRDAFVDFCLMSSTTTAQAWDTYTIFRQVFDETPREQRVRVMDNFFHRERPDMAVHVFSHMRSHNRADTVPAIDTYVSCLLGIARSEDEESLEVVYNQLKLDDSLEPNTYVHNALMIAHNACGQPRRALNFWDDIAASREGPTINSIHIALKACEDAPWGDEKAKQIWAKLNRTGIELDQALWASYAGALIGNGDVAGAIGVMEEAYNRRRLDMDPSIIGSLYNAAPGHEKRAEVETWAKGRYPEIWAGLEQIGMRTNADTHMPEFALKRHVDP